VGGKSPDINKNEKTNQEKNQKRKKFKIENRQSSEQFRWPTATSPPQKMNVWGPKGPIHLVEYI
jgi:hypothetical protein